MTDDLISRAEAIEDIRTMIPKDARLDIKWIEMWLKQLPSAQRTGKWKKTGRWGRVYRCDQCGNYLDFDGVNARRGDANYCPNCGARMDGKWTG